ncbi:hypothetical protein C3438_19645 [Bacillus velezensis]|uniref:hypothetical protein n=1 Tax=Bacillus amyloliquefaciens group TaxID=1938374 RepID=UPI000CE07217|nr:MULTISPECIES: hypothetical protein [Bacillus amyloliquefaciens group]AVB11534.1 hypothetical protein C3438_19645 [Bacillus velezensis]MCR6614551.1 hypothetical protein [Bacillus amyloliquefaciens]MEC0382952.1 hypothetical protein [Bacillus velezensis]QBG56549.1 hypothetical protein D2M30_2220 [Bacillus amyloliquefaciens]QMI88353.1 hypothetical protein H1Q60_19970 [Bacillus velezensis]
MGLLILAGIVFVITAIAVLIDTYGELILSVICGFVAAVVVLIVAGLIAVFFPFDNHAVLEEKVSVYSIKDNINVSGKFVLGSGIIDDTQYLYFVIEKEGFKSVHKVKAETSRVKEGNYKTPYVKKYRYEYTNKFVRFMFGESPPFKDSSYDFFLPEHTVTQEYKVDLE